MSAFELLILFLAVSLVGGGLLSYLKGGREGREASRRDHRVEMSKMPDEIATGTLVMSEEKIRTTIAGARVCGRTEQVYRTAQGVLIPVESKTRAVSRVYMSDVIQTSLQALALRDVRRKVADQGYVRTSHPTTKAVAYHPIQLMPRHLLERLVTRYFDVIEGRSVPTHQENRAACEKCGFRDKCWPGAGKP